MEGRAAAVPRAPCGPWLCLLVALALDVVRGQREGWGRAGDRRLGPGQSRAQAIPGSREPAGARTQPQRARPQRALRAGAISPRDPAPVLPPPRTARQLLPDPGSAGSLAVPRTPTGSRTSHEPPLHAVHRAAPPWLLASSPHHEPTPGNGKHPLCLGPARYVAALLLPPRNSLTLESQEIAPSVPS